MQTLAIIQDTPYIYIGTERNSAANVRGSLNKGRIILNQNFNLKEITPIYGVYRRRRCSGQARAGKVVPD